MIAIIIHMLEPASDIDLQTESILEYVQAWVCEKAAQD